MGIYRSLVGAVRAELTSADAANFIYRLNEAGIGVSDVCAVDDLTLQFTVSRSDMAAVQRLAQRKGESVRILARRGIIWPILTLRTRIVLLVGMVFLLSLCLLLPRSVLFVAVEGNSQVAANQILEAAWDAGVHFGASRRAVRSEKVKNRLLEELPQLQWAGVNTYGCRAVISVRERAVQQQSETPLCSNITAACDGVITSCTVTGGTGLCTVGEAVREGQALISGSVDSGGLLISGRAEGEIFAETRRNFSVRMPAKTRIRSEISRKRIKISLQFGKKRINFYKGSGISDASCVKMITQYYLTLPGGYRLPASVIVETTAASRLGDGSYPQADAAAQLSAYARDYLDDHTIALTVQSADEVLTADTAAYELQGQYRCTEMIGREQIGDFHGKAD